MEKPEEDPLEPEEDEEDVLRELEGADGGWGDWDDGAEGEGGGAAGLLPTADVFVLGAVHPTPAAALAAAKAVGFDLLALQHELGLGTYGRVRAVNFARAAGAAAAREGRPAAAAAVDAADGVRAGRHAEDERYLTPVVPDDPLLFALDDAGSEWSEDEDEGDGDGAGAGPSSGVYAAAAADEVARDPEAELRALRLENEALRLQLAEVAPESLAAPDAPTEARRAAGAAVEQPPAESQPPRPVEPRGAPARGRRQLPLDPAAQKVDDNYFDGYSYFDIHRTMLSDRHRTETYRAALERNPACVAGKTVLDIGCGTGVLSMFAARGGAASVIGVDGSAKMAETARRVVAANGGGGLGERVTILEGKVEELEALPAEKVDVIVSEWMGYCLLFETMFDTVIYARKRWLKPGGAVLPDRAVFYAAGAGADATSRPFWGDVYGLDMTSIGDQVHAESTKLAAVLDVEPKHVVTPPVAFKDLDLMTVEPEELDFTAEFELRQMQEHTVEKVHAVVVWFDTPFSSRVCPEHPVTLTTSPLAEPTHWHQTLLTLREPVALGPASTGAAPSLKARISITRSAVHRRLDIALEVTPAGSTETQTLLYEL